MPTYKLTYFAARGRAELVRVLFHYTGTPFEDVQLKREAWMEFKESGKTPFGLLPILEVDGTVLSSSEAIVCYIAEVFGLDGDTPLERARCRMVLDSLNDILNTFIRQYLEEKGDSRKVQLILVLVQFQIP
jgi:glutathione S-transferase